MRKRVFGRQFKRDTNERKALFKNLMSALVLYGRIQTTKEKAQAIRGQMERLITKARNGAASRQLLDAYLTPLAADKMITAIAPVFASRPGGYTRIIKSGRRVSDNAAMAYIELVESVVQPVSDKEKAKETKPKTKIKPKTTAKTKAKSVRKVKEEK